MAFSSCILYIFQHSHFSTVPVNVTVNVRTAIGCGPGGMFFLHALATKRKQLQEAGDIEGLNALPQVAVFEKSSSPGGVWRSDRGDNDNDNANANANDNHDANDNDNANDKHDANAAASTSTNMYEGLWTNGHKDGIEFFDYTFDDHFKSPLPIYLPRKYILEYMMARVTKHEDIFQHVQFNTKVQSVSYDQNIHKFVIITHQPDGTSATSTFDKCIWASGLNGKPKMIEEIQDKLSNFPGQIVHSSEMDKLGGSVKGKRILMIGGNFSAEDLALQCIKLGAEKIYISSRSFADAIHDTTAWPGNKVQVLENATPCGVKDGTTIQMCRSDVEDGIHEVSGEYHDIAIVIFCTGYIRNHGFIDSDLLPCSQRGDCDDWSWTVHVDDMEWKMKDNVLTEKLGHIEPAEELEIESNFVVPDVYRTRLLISNPNMMYLHEYGEYPLLEIDIAAWWCLAYITGEKEIPTKDQMLEANRLDLLNAMHEMQDRYEIDENYHEAVNTRLAKSFHMSPEYIPFMVEWYSHAFRVIARDMVDASYPLQFGNIDQLNETGEKLLHMSVQDNLGRLELSNGDGEDCSWKTFRDRDPSPFSSLITGTKSVSLKGKWLELDDEGNPSGTRFTSITVLDASASNFSTNSRL